MRQSKSLFLLFVIVLTLFSGCHIQSNDPEVLSNNANLIAQSNGFKTSQIKTKTFLLTNFQKFNQNAVTVVSDKKNFKVEKNSKHIKPDEKAIASSDENSLTIYVEGDGRAFITPSLISKNPTPKNPMGLKLAVLDTSKNVAYLARPCQYTPLNLDPACHAEYWADLRFSETVIDSMNEAIQTLKDTAKVKNLHLVGFSGGAAIVTLVAARRNDVASIRTVAGDLDHEAMTKFHDTTPLEGSLNPKQVTKKIAHIPQQHFIGDKDPIVPLSISESFVKSVNEDGCQGNCAKRIVLKNATHHAGWEAEWCNLLKLPLKCEVE